MKILKFVVLTVSLTFLGSGLAYGAHHMPKPDCAPPHPPGGHPAPPPGGHPAPPPGGHPPPC